MRKAAEQGYAPAQLDLGYLYEQGKGVAMDYVSAYTWYKAASAGGEHRAKAQMKNLSPLMTPEQVKRAQEAAAQLTQSMPAAPGYSESVGNSFLPPH